MLNSWRSTFKGLALAERTRNDNASSTCVLIRVEDDEDEVESVESVGEPADFEVTSCRLGIRAMYSRYFRDVVAIR